MQNSENDIKYTAYWCGVCKTPVIQPRSTNGIKICPICGNRIKYLCTDIRPVFPEERLLIEILLSKPFAYAHYSVWASKKRFYVDGLPISIPNEIYKTANLELVRAEYERYSAKNTCEQFNSHIKNFIAANTDRLESITSEAYEFVKDVAGKYTSSFRYTSFSGGKDSTVTSHIVKNALSDTAIKHYFGDTTLEFPDTYEYIERFKLENELDTARNNDRDFFDMCEIIGPPSRNMRWCCTMFKTGPIARVTDSAVQQGNILTFLGIRKSESVIRRKKYERINYDDSYTTKIQGQVNALPIFDWLDMDVWLYILSNSLDFNDAYRLGYERVGCYLCPNNSDRNQFITSIFMPEHSQKWYEQLLSFATRTGKPNPIEYVERGYWKARHGGQGLSAASSLKIQRTDCVTEENAKIYLLNKPVDESFWNLLTPLGIVSEGKGRKLLNEVIVLDAKTNYPVLAASPHTADRLSIKIKTFDGVNHREIQRQCGYQVRKYNVCQSCLKCEALCRYKAISVTTDGYSIDKAKCRHCGVCVSNKYLAGGCLMYRFLFDSEQLR